VLNNQNHVVQIMFHSKTKNQWFNNLWPVTNNNGLEKKDKTKIGIIVADL
jgi:hypothetical protein